MERQIDRMSERQWARQMVRWTGRKIDGLRDREINDSRVRETE
jgi:hypothetical protein